MLVPVAAALAAAARVAAATVAAAAAVAAVFSYECVIQPNGPLRKNSSMKFAITSRLLENLCFAEKIMQSACLHRELESFNFYSVSA